MYLDSCCLWSESVNSLLFTKINVFRLVLFVVIVSLLIVCCLLQREKNLLLLQMTVNSRLPSLPLIPSENLIEILFYMYYMCHERHALA